MANFFWVALGGGIGSAGRYAVSMVMARLFANHFPYATLTVNVLGSFIIGLAWMLIYHRFHGSEVLRLFIMVGILGGFTTFSSFSLETMNLLSEGQWLRGGMNIFLNLSLCLAGVMVGIGLGRVVA